MTNEQIRPINRSAIDLAHSSANFFQRRGYPYLAIEVVETGDFPSVQLWNDNAEIAWIIVCFDDAIHEAAAVDYAAALAAQEEYGAVAYAASSNCVIRADDMETHRW